MAAHLTPGEQAVADATPAWRALPTTQNRTAELRAIAGAARATGAAVSVAAVVIPVTQVVRPKISSTIRSATVMVPP